MSSLPENMIEKLIILVLQIKIIQQLLFDLYLWQLKEYRFDRVEEHLERTKKNWFSAWIYLTILSPFSLKKLPKLTGKSFLLLLINLGFLYLISRLGSISLIATLFATAVLILASIICFIPIEWTIRYLVYFLASKKLKKLQKSGLIVIGITGSYGKSTTKSFINDILSTKFKTLSTPGSINTPFAISHIILKQLSPSHKFFIVEMGAYKRGEIAQLCHIAHPNISIITGISNQHLALFGSQENLIKTKSEILEGLSRDSLVLINKSSEFLPNIEKRPRGKIIFYGTDQTDKKYRKFKNLAPIPDFLKLNLEPGLILAELYKIDKNNLKRRLKTISLPKTVVNIRKSRKGVSIIDDSRSSNFKGVSEALDYLDSLKSKNKVVIMPCLIELGQEAKEIHREIGKRLREVANLAIITTDDFFQEIIEGSGTPDKIILLKDSQKILDKLKKVVRSDSIILMEGRVDPTIIDYYV